MKNKVPEHLSHAFSLLELLTVAAIIAIIAALAIPGYLHNIEATKINTMWHLADPAKLAIEGMVLKNNASVSSITVDAGTKEYTTANISFVKCITVQGGVITVLADPAQFSSKVLWVSWTPTVTSGALTWTCNYSSDAAAYMESTVNNCSVGTAAYSADTSCT